MTHRGKSQGAWWAVGLVSILTWTGCGIERRGLESSAGEPERRMDGGDVDAASRDAGVSDAAPPPVDSTARMDAARDAGVDASCMPLAEICNGRDDDCDGMADEEGCPCDVVEALGSVYLFCTHARAWHAARDACEAIAGFRFVHIEDGTEDARLWAEARGRVGMSDWWIGLSEPEPGVYAWTDGTEVWRSGATGAYENFAGGAPGYSVPDDCGELEEESAGQWGEGRCGDAQPYVCETL